MRPQLPVAPLGSDQLRSYREEGYLVVRGFFGADRIESVQTEAESLRKRADLVDPSNLRCRFMPDVRQNGCTLFEVFDPIIDLSPACAMLARDTSLLTILEQIYGESAFLFKDKLIYKPPGARGYGIHQDWIAWPGFPTSFLTVLIALDEADGVNGCTRVFAGLHRRGCLAPAAGEYHEFSLADMGDAPRVDLVLAPGDIALFSGYTPHCSDPNLSARDRRQLFLSYNAASDGGDLRAEHYRDFHQRRRARIPPSSTDVYFR